MYKIVVSVLAISLSCVDISQGSPCPAACPDYYWRDYRGIVPDDALVGATNGNDTLYVGQVFFTKWNLLPAAIHSTTGLATTCAQKLYLVTNKYVKVLASPDNSIFEWIPVDSANLHLYLDRAVPGGSEVNVDIYIGRIRRGNQWLIGKVFTHDRPNRGFWVNVGNQTPINTLSYELLVFNCNKAM